MPTEPRECLQRIAAEVLPRQAAVLLAVSGGSDSMALLAAGREVLGDRAVVVHVDHGLRPDSGRDAAFVARAAAACGLPVLLERAAPSPADPGRGETAARRRRLDSLARAARRAGTSWVLLAHHLDDDLETLLLQLRRGHRGDRALCGAPTVRRHDAPAGPLVLVRPFLLGPDPPGREQLARIRRAAGLACRDDPTNRDERIARNALRARLARGELGVERGALAALRARARRRLAQRVARVAALLEGALRSEGLGCRLDAAALHPSRCAGDGARRDDRDDRAEDVVGHLAEVLRLLGACLSPRRRLVVRRALLERLADAVERARGELLLPGVPVGLRARVSPAGLHVPGAALAPGEPAARVLAALLHTPLHL